MVTLKHSVYKAILAELSRWIDILKAIGWDGSQLQLGAI